MPFAEVLSFEVWTAKKSDVELSLMNLWCQEECVHNTQQQHFGFLLVRLDTSREAE